jgi:hypothetical protein
MKWQCAASKCRTVSSRKAAFEVLNLAEYQFQALARCEARAKKVFAPATV